MTVSLRGTSVIYMSLFQFEFEQRKFPSASAETSVRRECPVKEEEFEEEGSNEDGEKGPTAKRRKVPKSQYNVLHLHENNLPLRLANQSSNTHFKNTSGVFLNLVHSS